jgi:putative MATE family efflux protein
MTRHTHSSAVAKPQQTQKSLVLPQAVHAVGGAVNALAWPIILENLFQTALSTADMMMVSRLGAAAIAGVGAAAQLLWVLQSAFGAVTTGTTVLVARFTGARQHEEANTIVKQSILVSVLFSVIFALLGTFWSEWFIDLTGAEAEVLHSGGVYLRIVMQQGLFMLAMFVLNGALRGAGDTRTPMIVTGGINVINIAVAYVLIFGKLGLPAMGVAGAAWGASIARAVGSALLITVLLRGQTVISISGRTGWKPDFAFVRRILKIGLPSMAEQLLMSGGVLLYGIIAISLGTLVYATQRITFQIISISFMPGMGFAMAATAIVGQYLGAKRADLAGRASGYAMRMAIIWMTAMGLAAAIFGNQVMRLFTNDPQMIRLGAQALLVIALSQPFQAIGQVLAGSLRGAGDTRFPMVATFAGVWLIRLPLGYLFGPVLGGGLSGIYVANVIDSVARALANWLRYRTGSWRYIEV